MRTDWKHYPTRTGWKHYPTATGWKHYPTWGLVAARYDETSQVS